MQAATKCRWGLTNSVIAQRNWNSILQASNAVVTAVASREQSRAAAMIRQCQSNHPFTQPPRALGSYQELIDSSNVDVIHWSQYTGVRIDEVVAALEAGKHVLSEKPISSSPSDLERITKARKRGGVNFMDGTVLMHSDRLRKMREVLDDGTSIGEIHNIVAHFCFAAPANWWESDNGRLNSQLEPDGCLGDLGHYAIRQVLWAMNYQLPQFVQAHTLEEHAGPKSKHSVPTKMVFTLFFENGVSAQCFCSFSTNKQQLLQISGSKGTLLCRDSVLFYADEEITEMVSGSKRIRSYPSLRFVVNNDKFDERFAVKRVEREYVCDDCPVQDPNAPDAKMINCLSQLHLEGRVDTHWLEIAVATAQVMHATRESADKKGEVVYL